MITHFSQQFQQQMEDAGPGTNEMVDSKGLTYNDYMDLCEERGLVPLSQERVQSLLEQHGERLDWQNAVQLTALFGKSDGKENRWSFASKTAQANNSALQQIQNIFLQNGATLPEELKWQLEKALTPQWNLQEDIEKAMKAEGKDIERGLDPGGMAQDSDDADIPHPVIGKATYKLIKR